MSDAVLLGLLAIAACCDWRQRKVPNKLTLPLLVLGLCYQWQAGTIWQAWSGVAGAFILTVGPVAFRGMGMGDQKLLMAVGAWSSWTEVYPLFVYSLLLCLLSVLLLPRTWSRLRDNLQKLSAGWQAHRQLWLPEAGQAAISFPYAVFLLGAFCIQPFVCSTGLAP
ncbi:A24 family peptidase [Brevibacillus nitrificans]|uniref:A24 family peptidase n=1 Tax=Brevibacillus nitrificans TaxID=651560 RepID=UPI00285E7018|nr:A24 family peptidase [Brevibacillus nitrificans]MDR7319508.1 prepilin peptidase CpaA [Brevibacillus nitrificans]